MASDDGDIDGAGRGSPAWRAKEDILVSVSGIGPTIARTLRAGMPELGSFDGCQVVALASIAPLCAPVRPVARQELHRRRGRAHIRTALLTGALVASRWTPLLEAFHGRHVGTRKPEMVARFATGRSSSLSKAPS